MTDRKTNALVRRTGDAKPPRRQRHPVEVPQHSDSELATAERYYCPVCGIVRRMSWTFAQVQAIVGNMIMPHEFATGLREMELCPGGEFDRVKDRAA